MMVLELRVVVMAGFQRFVLSVSWMPDNVALVTGNVYFQSLGAFAIASSLFTARCPFHQQHGAKPGLGSLAPTAIFGMILEPERERSSVKAISLLFLVPECTCHLHVDKTIMDYSYIKLSLTDWLPT